VTVAGIALCVDGRLPPLAPFEGRGSAPVPEAELVPESMPEPMTGPVDRPVLRDPARLELEGVLGETTCGLTLVFDGAALRLAVRGVVDSAIAATGLELAAREHPDASDDLLLQAILGPSLSLLLALHGVVSIHASAVERGGRALVFVGESGAGKSTLASHLAQRGWGRLADDILPAVLGPGGARARPWFPQLRLRARDQYRGKQELEIAGVFELERGEAPALGPLDRRRATLALVRHTVAARLFPPDLLRWHLDWATRVARSVPVYRLGYPRRFDALPAVARLLETVDHGGHRPGAFGGAQDEDDR
jgi:hypothetical protein